jgi:PAS domain S-box-containing protein
MEDQVKIYQDIANNMQVGLHVYHLEDPDDDSTLRMVVTNPAAAVHTGLTEEEVVGKTLDESFPNLWGTNHPQRYAEVARSGKALEFEDTYYTDDKIVNAAFAVKVYPLPKNCVGVIFENITKRKQAEEALCESEKRYRGLMLSLEAGIVVHAPDSSIIMNNNRASELLGLTDEQLKGKTAIDSAWKFVNVDNTPLAFEEYPVNLIIKLKKPIKNKVYGIYRPDKNEIGWVTVNGFPLVDNSGSISEIVISFIDITEQKQAEETLRQNRNMLDSILNTIPQSVFWKDRDSKFLGCNAQFANAVGLQSTGDIIGKTDFDLPWPKEEAEAYRSDDCFVMDNNAPKPHIIEPLQQADGSRLWIDTTKIPLLDDKACVYGVLGVYEDITERKQAEEKVVSTNKMLELVMNNIPQYIFWKDRNSVYLGCNKNQAKVAGLNSPEEIVGKTDFDLPWKKEEAEFFRECDQRVMNSGVGEYHIIEPQFQSDGKQAWLDTNKVPLFDLEGNVIGILGTYEDISDRKQAEQEIRTLNEDLEQRVRERTAQIEAANRELDAFAHSASHDLRGPLNRICGFSEALLEDHSAQLDLQGKDYLQRISNSSQQMGELIDDLLKLSRVSQYQISHEPVELSALVNVCLKELQAREPDRQVETVITPGLVAEADTALMRIALENLLNNAWKFSAGEELSRIEFGNTAQEGKEVYFIRDNGVGFDMKYAEKLFTAFQRLHDAQKYPGTGIGLSIVSRIISRHGGKVWVEGEVGKGACFYFTLPEL